MGARSFTVLPMNRRYPWFPRKTAEGLARVGFKQLARGKWQKDLHNGKIAVATHFDGDSHWELEVRFA